MSEDRETHTLTTPRGHLVVLRSWINGREKQRIEGTMFANVSTEGQGSDMKPTMSNSMLADRENTSIEAVVVSVDGNQTDVVERILDMHAQDYDVVTLRVQQIVNGDFDEKKEKASEISTTESSVEAAEESTTNDSI